MNKSIIVAAVSLSIMVVSRVIMGGLALWFGSASPLSALLPVAVALLILIGIVKGHRLAWQWGRLLGLLGAVVLTFTAIMVSLRIPEQPLLLITAVLVALQGVPLFPMFCALGTTGAREYFGVICPICGESNVKGGNFLFTKVICRQCNHEWS